MKKVVLLFLVFVSSTAFLDNNNSNPYSNGEVLLQLFSGIQSHYVDELNPEDLTKTAADAMLRSLDPYSYYIAESEQQKRADEWKGIHYAGIGIRFAKIDSDYVITDLTENYPAQREGMVFGEKIIAVNSILVSTLSYDSLLSIFRGKAGTTVDIRTKRSGGIHEYHLTREDIKSPAVPFAELISKDCGYISLRHFLAGSSELLRAHVLELKNKGATRLVLDIRGNTGGLVDEAQRSVNIFIPKGLNVFTTKGRAKEWNEDHLTDIEPADTVIPIVVLIDQNTISAGEIFAGAIQDYDRGVLIGKRTFGKGFVQGTRSLPLRNSYYMTSARYYTPSGRCIQELDYRNKDIHGNPSKISSNNKATFYTRNKRKVFQSGGIEPDISISGKQISEFCNALTASFLIFEFANTYRATHQTLETNNVVNDALYLDFVRFAKSKIHKVKLIEDDKFNIFTKTVSDTLLHNMSNEIQSIQKKLDSSKSIQLHTEKKEIMLALEKEIHSRYEYETGRYRVNSNSDELILNAIRLLQKPNDYFGLLNIKR